MMPAELRGLYAVTDGAPVAADTLAERVAAALRGGARLVQYRDKSGDAARRLAEARVLTRVCARHGVPLIINDDLQLAREVGAAGVHLGEHDPSIAEARALLGPQAIVGASCYDDLERACAAAAAGASYVAFGAVFPSPTKPQARRASPALLREAKRRLPVPVCAIGGITAANAGQAAAAGADLIAVISDLFAAPDVEAAARRLTAAFESGAGRG